ncbi:LOW QUALITY PROTEIN: hypothetical protein RJ639_004282 [Escallonia herrerae]|uniref:Root cap n=1 Tax=Escallonia herrerae TaxID=1293975 RepID=A0AA89AXU4_9ASTE|nr:LOW QUALITY PROTEIN: hypothetical protein RJ639_004282 [Escallonia herrerae]
MAQPRMHYVVWIALLALIAATGATPPGIANNPSHARCLIKKYKHCYNLEHVCPKFCPDQCTVECVSCKPMCSGSTAPPPESESPPEKTPTPPTATSPPPPPLLSSLPPPTSTPIITLLSSTFSGHESISITSFVTSASDGRYSISRTILSTTITTLFLSTTSYQHHCTSHCVLSTAIATLISSSSSYCPNFATTSENPSPSPPQYSPPPTPTSSTPPPTSTSPPPTPSTTPASPPTTTTPSPPSTTPPSPSSSSSPPPLTPVSPKKVKCKNKDYPKCYTMEHVCPSSCPGGCDVDCATCKPVCMCDMPGAVCQDPRFIGGDGITFYFHGKKDKEFCLFSDPNLHINAHFIGKRNQNMKRDFTWVQSIGILFDDHKIFIGAQKTSTWDNAIDRLGLTFDNEPIFLQETEGASWQPENAPRVAIARASDSNNVIVEVKGMFKITAKVVPITEEESKVHNYGITKDDCFAHLELGFKFLSLTDEVNGVLGQTYITDYKSKVKMGVSMPVMGGEKVFATSSLFATDCSVARFKSGHDYDASSLSFELPSLSCSSGMDGRGVVCKR